MKKEQEAKRRYRWREQEHLKSGTAQKPMTRKGKDGLRYILKDTECLKEKG